MMNLLFGSQILQTIAWLLALVESCLILYLLSYRLRDRIIRHVGASLALIAATSYAVGLLTTVQSVEQATWPVYILVTAPLTVQPLLLLATIAILKPHWLQGRRRWLSLPIYAIAVAPVLLLYLDTTTVTPIWFTGLDPETYTGGGIAPDRLTNGVQAPFVSLVYQYLLPLSSCIVAFYVALRNRESSRLARRLAWLIPAPHILAVVVESVLKDTLPAGLLLLIVGAFYSLVYVYAGLRHILAQDPVWKGRLPTRITALVLIIVVPFVLVLASLAFVHSEELTRQSAIEQLRTVNHALSMNISTWLDLNGRILKNLAARPEIVSMDPAQQGPLLEEMVEIYPHMYLVSTTDDRGQNVARSDRRPLQQYRTHLWYIAAKNGAPLTFEIIIDRITGKPAIVASAPINKDTRNFSGIVGVVMFASRLASLNQIMEAHDVGESQVAYIVDSQNRVVWHNDPAFEVGQQDLKAYQPVFALRDGERGLITYTDDEGQQWQAYISKIGNEWGVIVQQQEQKTLQQLVTLRQVFWENIVAATLILALLMWGILHWTFRPIDRLTNVVTAVAEGDLGQQTSIKRRDEIGALARVFNRAIEKIGGTVRNLEEQVAAHSQELEQRSAYTQASTEVGRTASTILDADQLIQEVVELIRDWFDLYYVGLFLTDDAGEWAELRAGTGEAGKAMLARGHRIRVGQGMIGWSIANAQSRVALQAEEDAVRLATVELPDTRSEAALPLRSRGQVIGALTVQSDQLDAFDEDFIAILQSMADQVAVALDNAHLFTTNQAALEAARRAYNEMSQDAWVELIRTQTNLAYRCGASGITNADEQWPPNVEKSLRIGETVRGNGRSPGQGGDADQATREEPIESLSIPIKVREDADPIGVLETCKDSKWTAGEIKLLEALADQLGIALEGARLYQEAQHRAARERLTREITDKMRRATDVDHIIQAAVDEIFNVLGASHAFVQLNSAESQGPSRASGHSGRPGDVDDV